MDASERRDAVAKILAAVALAGVVLVWPDLCGALGVALGGAAIVGKGRA